MMRCSKRARSDDVVGEVGERVNFGDGDLFFGGDLG